MNEALKTDAAGDSIEPLIRADEVSEEPTFRTFVAGDDTVFINEIHYDNGGADTGEFVEIAGPAGTNLAGWSIVLYNGNDGNDYDTELLTGTIPDLQAGYGTLSFSIAGIQNGAPDGIALANGTTLVQFLSYEGSFTAAGDATTNGPAGGMASTDIGVAQSGDEILTSLGLQGTGTTYDDFTWTEPMPRTPGAVNTGQTFGTVVVPTNEPVSISCPADVSTAEGVAATANVTATDPDGTVDDIAIQVAPAPTAGSISITAESPAAAAGGTASATVTVSDAVPAGTYTVSAVASNSDLLEQTEDCDFTVLVTADVPVATGIVINEVDSDTPSTDVAEFVELYDGGTGNTSLDGLVLVFYNGSNDLSYAAFDLDGHTTSATGYFTAGNAAVAGVDLVFGSNGLQNGQDAVALYVGDASDFPNGTAVTTANLRDAIVYDTGDADDAGLLVLLNAGQPQVDEASFNSATESSQRCPNGSGGERNTVSYIQGNPTPDGLNFCPGDDPGPTVEGTTPRDGSVFIAPGADITIEFSESVNLADAWFEIECSTSGAHTATVTPADPAATFTLNPDADFVNGETCTVTLSAGAVTDEDTDDPPDRLPADYVFDFSIGNACTDATVTFIHQVQGAADATPIAGTTVTVEGIVVGDYQGGADSGTLRSFALQEEDADADDNMLTSEGIFVFEDFGVDVAAGDLVSVTGRAAEFNGLTQLDRVSNVTVCDADPEQGVSPAQPSLPVSAISDFERWEGMLVNFDQTLTVTEVFNLARFGEVVLSGIGRQYASTHQAEPGAPAEAAFDLNARARIILDDANTTQNADPTRYPQGGLSASNTLRVGATVTDLTAVMHFGFGNYRLQPVGDVNFQGAQARPLIPPPVGGRIQVAAFNVLNYFNGDGAGGGFPTARGATTPAEFQRQRTKIIEAIAAMDAEVVGLMEIENDNSFAEYAAIEDLVDGLNAKVGAGTYAYIPTGVVGTDAITVAIIYQTDSVTPVNAPAILTSAVDPRFNDDRSRPAIAQTFAENLTGARFTVAVNHLKSKGSGCGAGDDAPDTGGGNCNATRTLAAQALADWLASDPTNSGDPDVLIIGDLNAYKREAPIDALREAGYVDLLAALEGSGAYSYVFMGWSGYLDHGLASATIVGQVTDTSVWHINADEPGALDYNVEFESARQQSAYYAPDPFRSSDHDPVLIGLNPSFVPVPPVVAPPVVTPPVVTPPVTPPGRSGTAAGTGGPAALPNTAVTPLEAGPEGLGVVGGLALIALAGGLAIRQRRLEAIREEELRARL